MTGSKYCKSQGLDSVVELSDISGVAKATLDKWWHTRNKQFVCLVAGAVSIKNKNKCSACKNRSTQLNIYCACICKYNVDDTRNNTDRSLYEDGK